MIHPRVMSDKCHKQTHAPQQTKPLFDLLIGDGDERLGYREAEISPHYSIGTARRWAHGQQSHISHCTIAPNQFAFNRMDGIDLSSLAILQMRRYLKINKANKGGAHDNRWASFSICR